MEQTFKVQAKFFPGHWGYFGGKLVNDGDILMVTEKQFSSKWMKKLGDVGTKEKPRLQKAAVSENVEDGL